MEGAALVAPRKFTSADVQAAMPADIPQLAVCFSDGFADKTPRCWCLFDCMTREQARGYDIQTFRKYEAEHPAKISHAGYIRDLDSGEMLGACQLQLSGDPGDMSMPGQGKLLEPGHAHLEKVCCAPGHTGQGVGSALLDWAHERARADGAAHISLQVVGGNRAKGLYQRYGYADESIMAKEARENGKDVASFGLRTCCTIGATRSCLCCGIYFCLGCRYVKVDDMIKDLSEPPPQQAMGR